MILAVFVLILVEVIASFHFGNINIFLIVGEAFTYAYTEKNITYITYFRITSNIKVGASYISWLLSAHRSLVLLLLLLPIPDRNCRQQWLNCLMKKKVEFTLALFYHLTR
jgi:hypothetical protein